MSLISLFLRYFPLCNPFVSLPCSFYTSPALIPSTTLSTISLPLSIFSLFLFLCPLVLSWSCCPQQPAVNFPSHPFYRSFHSLFELDDVQSYSGISKITVVIKRETCIPNGTNAGERPYTLINIQRLTPQTGKGTAPI